MLKNRLVLEIGKRVRIRALLILFALISLSTCQSIGYYTQSVVGHSKLMMSRTPLDEAIALAEPQIGRKLKLSKELKQFATERLSLPNNKSYSTYVDLKREYPVWVVTAAPALSLESKQWCYPVIGCAAYRGYFSESAAKQYASNLEEDGWETSVGGAPAYSTLGWFSDPLLPSMIKNSDAAFAEMLFHELAHQVLYINGESSLNEAFASLVGEQGALLWLRTYSPEKVNQFIEGQQARRDFASLVERLKVELRRVYSGDHKHRSKLQAKEVAITSFRRNYSEMKITHWSGKGYFDNWLLKPINNARLGAFSTYHTKLPELEALFKNCDSNFDRFYQRLKKNHSLEAPYACD